MIIIKKKHELEKMKTAGQLLAGLFSEFNNFVKPGLTTQEIDNYIAQFQKKHGLISQTKGYLGYRHASCISINDEVVHGIPGKRKIEEGDLVKIDICAAYKNYCADMARCFFIGDINKNLEVKNLVDIAQLSLDAGISQAKENNKISDISAAVENIVKQNNYGIVREFAGHGIGKKMHEDPEIVNYGKPNQGPVIRPGMAFAIEPMITAGSHKIYILPDGWTVKTLDGSLAAHVEDTVIITHNGPEIITRSN